MDWVLDLIGRVATDVWRTVVAVWPFLLISIAAAAAVTVYAGTDRISTLLHRRVGMATAAAVGLATLTPFCSCGTTAVLLGMMATTAPWAPLVAFMVASPLTSPSELILSAGLFGWPFAWVFFLGTIFIGLAAGFIAHAIDRRGWLDHQARMEASECGASCTREPVVLGVGPGTAVAVELARPSRTSQFLAAFRTLGTRMVGFFVAFTAVGYLVIEAIPTGWIVDWLGGESALAVPLAAILGVPAYINTEASLPLVAGLMDGGMGAGPAMAFLVTGAGTSIGAITGLFVIARARVVWLTVALLFAGALGLGWIAGAVL